MNGQATVAVCGAGPKGLAIAAKHVALRDAGFETPDLIVFDSTGPAAHWNGANGYTDGQQQLGTYPEQDLGFPYPASWGTHNSNVNETMRSVSWPAFLQDRGRYGEWLDRDRPRPTHALWAEYLSFAASRMNIVVKRARMDGAEIDDGRWRLRIDDGHGDVHADALVITGPGPALQLPGQEADSARVLDGRNYWEPGRLPALRDSPDVAVLGSGETAAAVTRNLVDRLPRSATIEVITTNGVIYTRGESYFERLAYTDPDAVWPQLSQRARHEFIRRTDRGVFSPAALEEINQAENVRVTAGHVDRVREDGHRVLVSLTSAAGTEELAFDLVISAIGFDVTWWTPLLGPRARAKVLAAVGGERIDTASVQPTIGRDLSLTSLTPALHLPTLAGLAQGPGFANLTCLGRLSDRLLAPYVRVPLPLDTDSRRVLMRAGRPK